MTKKLLAVLLTLCMILTLMPGMAFAENEGSTESDNTEGKKLEVEWQGSRITEGTIEIDEGSGVSLPITYDGKTPDGSIQGESLDTDVCNAGVSPDNRYFELYLSGNAKENDSCTVKLLYGDKEDPVTLTFTVKVTAGIKLKFAEQTVMNNGEISGAKEIEAQVLLGQQVITGYDWGIEGTAVCAMDKNADGTLSLRTIGNGYSTFTISYQEGTKKHEACFVWHGSGIADTDPGARNLVLAVDGVKKEAGDRFTLKMGTFTAAAYFNGTQLKKEEYDIQVFGGNENDTGLSTEVKEDGTFTITVEPGASSCYKICVEKKTGNQSEKIAAPFEIFVQNPEAYVLQFYGMEKLENGSWRNTNFATLGIFKKAQDEMYAKFIVTDEDMRRIDESHFVKVTPDKLVVMVYDESQNDYVEVGREKNPFTFEMVNGQENLMRISYDRSKDQNGPAYMLVYTDWQNDKYLCNDEADVQNKIFLWTRSVTELMVWENLQRQNDHWTYDARKTSQEEFEKDNEECDVKDVAVEMPAALFGNEEGKIEIVENESTLAIQTNLATVTLDDEVLSQIDKADADVTLGIRKLEEEDSEYQAVSGALKEASEVVDLTLRHEKGTISDFGEGTATVELPYAQPAEGKTPQVYYVNDAGEKTPVKTSYDEKTQQLTFETGHFSMYAVEEVKKPEEGTTPSGGGSTGGISSGGTAPAPGTVDTDDEKTEAAKIEQAKAGIKKLEIKARSSKTKNGVKVVLQTGEEGKAFAASMQELGYTVKYRFYRSTKKSSGYKAMLTKTKPVYVNTSGKKGTKYFYRAQIRVYDENGTLVAATSLKQCKYACRSWSK